MFRNVRLYRLHSPWPASEEALSTQLADAAFKPCGSLSQRSTGWESPAPEHLEALCRRVAAADLLLLRHQSRLLPAAAINEALADRVAQFTARTGQAPSRNEKRDLKDQTHAALLPKALLKSDRIRGICLHKEKLLAIDTSSQAQAELFLDRLRDALGTLQVTPLAFKAPLGELLHQVFLGKGPIELTAARECRMQDPGNGQSIVNWMDIDLSDAAVRRHVTSGMRVDRLALQFDDQIGCVLDREAVVRKFRYLTEDGMDSMPDEDPLARLDADLALFSGTLTGLCRALKKHQGGYQ